MKPLDADRVLRIFSGARLGVASLLLILGPIVADDLMPGTHTPVATAALLAAIISSGAILLWRARAQRARTAWLICLLDVVLITAVVSGTGGPRSIFSFLYVLSVVSACVLLSRTGGLAMAGIASALYIGLVFGRTIFPLTAVFEPPDDATALEVLTIFLNAGTLLVVAIVAGGLAERFHVTHEELLTRRRDLRDLEAFKDLVFESVGTGLIALDHDHTVTAFNRAAEEITGLGAGRALGRAGSEIFGASVPLADIDAAIGQTPRAATRHEATMRRPDGTSVPVRMTFSALRSGDGTRLGLIAACEDLSIIREMESRMRHADRLATVGRMAANIAHEIRNPLASLSGAIETLTTQALPDDERGRLSQIVLRESDRLNDIIKGFLEYARPAPLHRQTIKVAEVIDEVLVLVEVTPHAATIKIARDVPPEVSWPLDPQQFRQTVWNVCRNAIEAMPDGGELRVTGRVQNDTLHLRIADSGAGIEAAHLPQVFEPFFSTKSGGSGLGLAIVHRIVTEHGGQVDVESEAGFGTTVLLRFPRRHA